MTENDLIMQYKELVDKLSQLYFELNNTTKDLLFDKFMVYEETLLKINELESRNEINRCWCNANKEPCKYYNSTNPALSNGKACNGYTPDDLGICRNVALINNSYQLHRERLKYGNCFSVLNPINRKFTIKEYIYLVMLYRKYKESK